MRKPNQSPKNPQNPPGQQFNTCVVEKKIPCERQSTKHKKTAKMTHKPLEKIKPKPEKHQTLQNKKIKYLETKKTLKESLYKPIKI